MDSVLDEAEQAIFEISENKVRPSFSSMKDIVKDSFKTIEKLYESKELITGVPSGFEKLDEYTAGLQRSDLIIVAGRPSMGKTAFALNIAQNAALAGTSVAVFSLENVEGTARHENAGIRGQGGFPASPEGIPGGNGLAEAHGGSGKPLGGPAVHSTIRRPSPSWK